MGRSSATLFCDVALAFDSVVRERVLGLVREDPQLEERLRGAAVRPRVVEHLMRECRSTPVLSWGEFCPHLRAVLADARVGTWMSVPGARRAACASQGTRPGDPY
eukprot:5821172-Alexandrium_andersonii.AAC.1